MPGPLPPGHPDAGIDLLTTAEHWPNALELLGGGHAHRGTAGYGRVATACLYPQAGPALHLHADTRWLGVPMRPRRLLARARPGKHGLLIPAPPDRLRIRLAEALFQTRVLDLSMLVEVRELLVPDVMTAARAEAEQEGWRADFEEALRAASDAVDRLNHRRPGSPRIPVAGLARAGEQPPGPADRTRPSGRCGRCATASRGRAAHLLWLPMNQEWLPDEPAHRHPRSRRSGRGGTGAQPPAGGDFNL